MSSPNDNLKQKRPVAGWLINLGMLVALAILLIAANSAYRNIVKLNEASDWVTRTQQVINATESLLEKVVKAESSERGFLLTDEKEHLERYQQSAAEISNELNTLDTLTKDNEEQQKRIEALGATIEKKLKLMDRQVKLPAKSRKESFIRDRLLTVGTELMQAIRNEILEIRRVETKLLDARLLASKSARFNAVAMSLLTTGIAVSLLVASFLLMRRAQNMRTETERLAMYNQRLLDSTGEGIYGIDHQGNCTFMNNAGALILGGRPEEFLGRQMHEVIHHTHADGTNFPNQTCPIYQAVHNTTGCRVDDDIFWRLDGESVPVAYSSFPLLNGNVAEGAVVTFMDITGQKREAQELIAAKEAAEHANEAKSQFLANMSHELRTPLNAVIMYSELLQEESEDRELDEFIPDLQRIRNAGKHLLELVNSLLDLSKIEAGKMELCLETFEVEALVGDVATTIEPLVAKNNNTLIVETSEVSTMRNDMTKIRQVLFNLLSNACKFTHDGTIKVNVASADDDSVRFEVADSGIGMNEEQTARLFQPFMQADASTTRKYGGTGLGLAIIKRFTDLMGGEVSVSSEIDVGTTFVVSIPREIHSSDLTKGVSVIDQHESNPSASRDSSALATTSEIPGSADAETSGLGRKKSVLVIDDDAAVRDVMMRVLLAEGINPVTASESMEGIEVARKLHPDLIVLDVLMPRVDGWSVLGILKADPELADIPVIMQTVRDDRDMAFLLGAADYVVKPVESERFIAAIQKHLSDGQTNVLIVEDDEPTREALVRMAERAGLKVIAAENGLDAINFMKEHSSTEQLPDLILLDLMMPIMDGFEFLEQFQENSAWNDIPVVVLTAKSLTKDETAILNGSVERVLTKGLFNRESLISEIRRIVGGLAATTE